MVKKYRITALVIVLAIILQLFGNIAYAAKTETKDEPDPYFEGKGIASEPFIIDSKSLLEKVADLVNEGESKYISAYYLLENDIDLSGTEWTPIGSESHKFKGTFDGNGNTIYELTITEKNASSGLFGYVYKGNVKNVNLSGGTISGTKDVGSIAGYNSGMISNCTSTVMIACDDVNTGGISGRNTGTIRNCRFDGTVVSKEANAGAVAGINSGTIDGCITEASVLSTEDYAGGIAGTNSGTVINCGSLSYVSSTYAGGIVGNNTGSIENCYNLGDVGESSEYAGGIAGKNSKTITNCYSGEFINADAYTSGGIVGTNSKGTVSLCYYISVGDSPAVGEKTGGTIDAVMMTDKNMRNSKFADTLNKNLKSGYSTWNSVSSVNDGFPTLLISSGTELRVIRGEEYQSGDATPASSDGKTSVVKYTAYASRWFTGGIGDVLYEIIEEDAKGTITISESTGYIVYTPNKSDADKDITIVVTARDGEGYCTGNVTITVNVNDMPDNQSGVKNSRISKSKADYDKQVGHEDNLSITLKVTLNGNSLVKLVNENYILEKGVDYTIEIDDDDYDDIRYFDVTIKRSYLDTLSVGKNIITFVFTEGASPELTVTVSDTSQKTYTVKFMNSGKAYYVVEDIPHGTTIDLPDKPEKSNASFVGWYTRSGGSGDKFTNKTKIEEDYTVYAYFKTKSSSSSGSSSSSSKTKTYSIKASCNKGGTISPSGSQKYEEGDSQKYTIKANAGYIISDVTVDGASKGEISSYTFSSIDKGHTIKVTFKEDDGTGKNSVHKPYMKGYSDDTFRPDTPITRSEAAVIIARISEDFDEMKYYENTFYDVNGDIWYQPHLGYAVSMGYINGYEGDVFRPNNNISRAEFCTLVHKYLGLKLSKKTTRFIDCKGHWADNYIKDLVDIEAINGYQTGLFNPDGAITRAEVAKIINAVRGRTPNIEAEVDNPFVDIDQYHWAYYEVMEATLEHKGAQLHKAI